MLLVHGDQDGEHDPLQRRVSLGCVLTPAALRVPEVVPVKQSRAMAAKLQSLGHTPVLLEAPGSPHFAMNGPEPFPEQWCAHAVGRRLPLRLRLRIVLCCADSAPRPEEFEAEGATKRFVYEEEVMAFLRQHLELQEAGGGGGSTAL